MLVWVQDKSVLEGCACVRTLGPRTQFHCRYFTCLLIKHRGPTTDLFLKSFSQSTLFVDHYSSINCSSYKRPHIGIFCLTPKT